MISVVIPTCRRARVLRRCLESLERQSYRDFEVIVVQCETDAQTSGVLSEYSRKLCISLITQSGGLVPRMDVGFRKSRGDIVVRTDDDVVADDDWLSEIVGTFGMSRDIGGVSGPTLIPHEKLHLRDVFMFLPQVMGRGWLSRIASRTYVDFFLEGQPHAVGRVFKSGAWSPGSNLAEALTIKGLVTVDYLEACNMAVRRSLIERAGGLDFNYKSTAEWSEVDLCFRIRKLGYRLVFNPRAIVHHMVSRSGVFREREFAAHRMMNLIYFYFEHVKPDTVDKCIRFLAYLTFLQVYWIYKFTSTRNSHYLGGISGTVRGLSFGFKNSRTRIEA